MNDQVFIQMQLHGGMWRTYSTTVSDPQMYTHIMRQLAKTYPDKRIRAVDNNNRLLDMM